MFRRVLRPAPSTPARGRCTSSATPNATGSAMSGTGGDTTGTDTTGGESGTTGTSGRVETRETREPIAPGMVEGARVYDRRGERSGTVCDSTMGERHGRVARAAMGWGRLLRAGGRRLLLPREALTHGARPGGRAADPARERPRNPPGETGDNATGRDVPDRVNRTHASRLSARHGARSGSGVRPGGRGRSAWASGDRSPGACAGGPCSTRRRGAPPPRGRCGPWIEANEESV